ncbi:hypothetical protein ABPG72_020592 [Tetrahymena utriculariae]
MANQKELFGFIKKSDSHESQNYLSGILLNTEGITFSNTINNLSQNQKLEEIQVRQETFIQNNLDNTIQKSVKANIAKLKKQLNIKMKDQCIFNMSQNQFLFIIDQEGSNQIQNNVKQSNYLSKNPSVINQAESILPIQLDMKQEDYQVPNLHNQVVLKETKETNQRIEFNEAKNQENQIDDKDPQIQLQQQDQSKYLTGNLDPLILQINNPLLRKCKNPNILNQKKHETTQQNTLENNPNKKFKSQLSRLKKQGSNQRNEYCQIKASENQYLLILENIGQNIIKSQLTKKGQFKNQENVEIEILSNIQVPQNPNQQLNELFISPNSSLKNEFKCGYERIQNQIEEKGDNQDMNQLQELSIDNIQSENCEQQQMDVSINQDDMPQNFGPRL